MVNGNSRRSASDRQSSGMHTGRVERLPVVRHVVVRVPQRPLQPVELQGAQLVHRRPLDRLEGRRVRRTVLHLGLLPVAEDRWRVPAEAATLPGAMTNQPATPPPPAARCGRGCPPCCATSRSTGCCSPGRCCRSSATGSPVVVLPFAVLAVGGDVGDVAIVSAAQFLPFAVLALPAGVWADRLQPQAILDRLRRRAVRRASSPPACCSSPDSARGHAPRRSLAAVYGAADAFFAPAFTGLLPGTVAPVNLQPANALARPELLDRLHRRPGARRPARRVRRRPGRRAAVRRRDLRGVDRLPDPAAAADGRRRAARRGPGGVHRRTSSPASRRAGRRCAAARG